MTGGRLLDYETPVRRSADETFDTIIHLARRVIFAGGIGLFFYGFGCWLIDRRSFEEVYCMAWGSFFAAITMPWPWRKRA